MADTRAAEPLEGPFAGVPFLVKDLAQEYAGFPTTYGSRSLEHDVAMSMPWSRSACSMPGWSSSARPTPRSSAPRASPRTSCWDRRAIRGTSTTPPAAPPEDPVPRSPPASSRPQAPTTVAGRSASRPRATAWSGLKLSRGLTPYGPQGSESMFGMVTQGVLSRTVRDSAALLDVVAGGPDALRGVRRRAGPSRSSRDSTSAPAQAAHRVLHRLGHQPRSGPGGHRRCREGRRAARELGHEVEQVSPPHDDEALARDFLTIWFAQLHGQISGIKRRLGAPRQRLRGRLARRRRDRPSPPASGRSSSRWTTSTCTSARSLTSTSATTSCSPRRWPSRR